MKTPKKHELIMRSGYDPLAAYLINTDDRPWYIPDETRDYLIWRQGHICAICKRKFKKADLHIDHIKAVANGGTAALDNLQVLCRNCNLSKSDHHIDPRSYEKGYVIPLNMESEKQISNKILDKLASERD